MSPNEWLVLGALVIMIAAMVSRLVSPTVGVVGALISLYAAGVVDAGEAFSGFSNPAPLSIAALYVVAGGVDRSGALAGPLRRVLGSHSASTGRWRLLASAALLSGFVANTPVVAMLISPVRRWAENRQLSPSRLLIPLSYATIVGGTVTLIGTSTNLVASGLVEAAGGEPFGFFEPARLGLPFALMALLLIGIFGSRLMPDRFELERDEVRSPFTASLLVDVGGPLDGVSILAGELRNLSAVYLVGVTRDEVLVAPVDPSMVLRGGDVVTFAGRVNQVVQLTSFPGLTPLESDQVAAMEDSAHSWYEAVVGATSPLIGKTIKQAGFRRRYQGAVLALNRAGQGLDTKLGSIPLQVGDSLLIVADNDFRERWKYRGDFLLIHRRSEPPPSAAAKAPLAVAILAAVAMAPVLGVADVLKSAVLGAAAMVMVGVLSPRQARQSVNIDVVVMIAASIGIGSSVASSGLAERLAVFLVDLTRGGGTFAISLVLVATTLLLTEVITNAGAVAIMVPVALRVADNVGGDQRLLVLGIALAASASFLSPVGYQTNTMVFGPGRYRASDYLRLGAPLTALVLVFIPLSMTIGHGLW